MRIYFPKAMKAQRRWLVRLRGNKKPVSPLAKCPAEYVPTKPDEGPNAWRFAWGQPCICVTYEEALAAWNANPEKYEGINYVLHPYGNRTVALRIVCFDFDGGLDDAGNVKPQVQQFIDTLQFFCGVFVEKSRSGKGVHVFVLTVCAPFANKLQVEVCEGVKVDVLCSAQVACTGIVIGDDCDLSEIAFNVLEGFPFIAGLKEAVSNSTDFNFHSEWWSQEDRGILPEHEQFAERMKDWEPCIEGQGASDVMIKAARYLVLNRVYDWSALHCLEHVKSFYEDGVTPYPWEESELQHKLEDAYTRAAAKGELRTTAEDDFDPIAQIESAAPAPSATSGNNVRPPLTDAGNAELFARQYAEIVRHVSQWKKWIIWNGKLWLIDESGLVYCFAIKAIRSIRADLHTIKDEDEVKKIVKHSLQSEASHKLDGCIKIARSTRPLPTDHSTLNSDPYLVNCNNGTIDLRTGDLRPHSREDLITKITPFDYLPSTAPDRFQQFLDEIFLGDNELIAFVQRLFGHALIGAQLEHVFPVFWGAGANGKTTLTRLMLTAFGDYGLAVNKDFLMATKFQRHSTEVMGLYQVRLAVSSETDEGARINEAFMKNLTGGNIIRGRHLYQEEWSFQPSHTICLETNHKPKVVGTDPGTWRRICLVPFLAHIPPDKRDANLLDKLVAEIPAILPWLVQGCLAWQREGLKPPAKIIAATEQYRNDSDLFGSFINECCDRGPSLKVRASELYEAYSERAKSRGEFPQAASRVEDRLHGMGIEKRHTKQGQFFIGISLNQRAVDRDFTSIEDQEAKGDK